MTALLCELECCNYCCFCLLDEDGSDYYLVDFQKKAIDAIVEDREASRKKEAEEEEAERVALAAEIPKPAEPDEEW